MSDINFGVPGQTSCSGSKRYWGLATSQWIMNDANLRSEGNDFCKEAMNRRLG
jgi:hypothetical protein